MSIFPIFKVNKLSDTNIVDSIYVFYGSQDIDDPNNMFSNDPTNKAFADVFNKDELDYISTNKINVIFVNQSIHTDDSIGVIKLKIFEAIKKKASMSELYLFCLKFEKLNPSIKLSESKFPGLAYERLDVLKIIKNKLKDSVEKKDGFKVVNWSEEKTNPMLIKEFKKNNIKLTNREFINK